MEWRSFKTSWVVGLMLIVAASAWAQTGTTSLHGSVADKTGAVIVGASVRLSNAQQGLHREATTNSSGEYEFLALPPGNYVLVVEMTGFRKYEQKNLQLLVNLPATTNLALEVGTTSEIVEVSAQTETLNATDASLGNAFNESQVKELPLEGRNVPDLLSLQPGVAYTNNRPDVPTWDTRNGAVNGARSDQSNVTVDGIAVNDEGGHAFTSVLPVTLDSVQEFRVTTTNYNADQGSSSGAQVAMVTKSGTNEIHGSAYEYHRNTYTSANDFFVKSSELQNCISNGTPISDPSCNKAPKLIRNIFGGSLGGPIKKDRLYLFMNFEGTRRAEAQSQTVAVPSLAMRDGVMQYACADPAACAGGTVTGISGATYAVAAGNNAVSPVQLTNMDPLHVGPSKAVLAYLNTFPAPNCNNAGDGLNYSCFNFSAPISDTKNEYISRMDYNITRDAKQRISLTGALRNQNNAQTPFLPGQTPSQSVVNYNKGLIVNYSSVLTNTLVNNFRYGFVRESVGIIGNSNQDWIYFRGLNDQTGAVTRTNSFQRPVHTIADDLSWIYGKHTWQFGTQISFIRTPSVSYSTSFSDGSANASWTTLSGYAQKKSPLNPAYTCANSSPSSCTANGTPFVDPSFANSYDFPLQALLGMVTEVDAQYNFKRDGSPLADGSPIQRRYAIDGYEFYGQDTWKLKPTLTVTLGLRWSLFSPPWETNKLQVAPTTNLDNWFQARANAGANGAPSNGDTPVAFDWSGPANGKPGYYSWDKKDFGPRVAFAWAPRFGSGLLGNVLGTGKTTIRAGFGMVYDRFGQGIADDFGKNGSFGLSTQLANPAGFLSPYNAPRLTSINSIPTTDLNGNQIFLSAPPAVFPQTYPQGNFAIAHSIDAGIKSPYSYTLDFSVGRELPSGFTLEVSYVGRLAHRLLTQLDVATPLNLKDPKSGVDYFTAVTALAKVYRTGVSTDNFNPSMVPANVAQYWSDVIKPLQAGDSFVTGSCGNNNTTVPVVAVYDLFCGNSLNETTGLLLLDYYGLTGASGNSYLPAGGQYTFYNPQYATLYVWKSMGTSNYNAMQVNLKHKMSHGVQFDFAYTFSKSIDLSSDAERVGTINGTGAQVQNAWSPFQFRSVSDFDATHQITANWVADLPFGRNRYIGRNVNRAVDAVIGGWQVSGLGRWTSGFPFSVGNGFQWPTDWDLSGNGIQVAPIKTGTFYDPKNIGAVSAFSNFSAGASSFREPFPGEAGQRNNLRGPGFFTVDMGLSKRWTMPWKDTHAVQFRWEVFNVTNSKRFDAQSLNSYLDVYGTTFMDYTRLSTKPRVMEFALRYEF
ncbi:MAG: Cna B-type protein [Candidatus Acidoferrum typicum]|nr:Cna B-type protein [Candidatus Acidoferrum typicum]